MKEQKRNTNRANKHAAEIKKYSDSLVRRFEQNLRRDVEQAGIDFKDYFLNIRQNLSRYWLNRFDRNAPSHPIERYKEIKEAQVIAFSELTRQYLERWKMYSSLDWGAKPEKRKSFYPYAKRKKN